MEPNQKNNDSKTRICRKKNYARQDQSIYYVEISKHETN